MKRLIKSPGTLTYGKNVSGMGARSLASPFLQIHEWKEKMEKAGFVDVKDVQYKVCHVLLYVFT